MLFSVGDLGRKILFADVDVSLASDTLASFTIHRFVSRLRCGKAVNIAVEHAERRCDEHCVMNLEIGCAQVASACDRLCRDLLATPLYLA